MADITATSPVTAPGAAGRIDTGRTRLADSYETFISLLTTQLKNQDPTSPLDTNQFTQQLVQMTGVEQQLLTNDLLKSLAGQASGGLSSAVGFIGKTVTAEGNTAVLTAGRAEWSYALPRTASAVTLDVLDGAGRVIRRETGEIGAGAHAFVWDGKDALGATLPDGGTYRLRVAANDTTGAAMTAALSTTGVVRALEQGEGGETLLLLSGTRTPLTAVTAVRDAA